MAIPTAVDEQRRLESLGRYDIMDSLPEECYDGVVAMAADICGTPIALFTLLDEGRQWFKSAVGLDIRETARAISFCTHTIAGDAFLMVENAQEDPRFVDNPLVLGAPNIRFYAGVPVRSNEHLPLGTLCVIDRVPRSLSKKSRLLLESLAREIEAQLEIRRISNNQQRLIEERAVLMNMVSHDARGVFGVLGWSIAAFRKEHGAESRRIKEFEDAIKVLQQLYEGILEISKQDSIALTASLQWTKLDAWLESTGLRAATATAHVEMQFEKKIEIPDREFQTDTVLLERIIVNLYANAINACSPGATITMHAFVDSADALVFIIEDDGPGVSSEIAAHIFEPYFSIHGSGQTGDGLGLPICRLAADALGGTIQYMPRQPNGARFVVTLPAEEKGVRFI